MPVLSSVSLTESHFKALSEVTRDIAQVFFASVVVTPLVSGIDKINWVLVGLGMVGSFVFWGLSLVIAEKGKL